MKLDTLRVQVGSSLARGLISPSLPRFMRAHPGLRVQLCGMSSNTAKTAEDIDVAICIGPVAGTDLVVREIAAVRLVTCVSPEFLERERAPEHPADLAASNCIALLDPSTQRPHKWLFRRGQATYTISPAAPLAFSDADSAVAAAVRGAGYVRVLSVEAEQQIAAGLLQPVLEEWHDESQPIAMVHTQGRAGSDEIAAFASFVAGLFPLARPQAERCSESSQRARSAPAELRAARRRPITPASFPCSCE